jgi:hypothetical protein
VRTSELIDALVADPRPKGMSLGARFALALAGGALASALLFALAVGMRANFTASLSSIRFVMKFVDSLALALPAALLSWRLMRPEARAGALALMFLAPFLLLAGGVVMELTLVPADLWGTRLIGSNAVHCLLVIPSLSIAPLAALLFVLRQGAPANPRVAGALAGAAAAGIAATLYAANCPDDSPLFVASWYPLATLIVVAVGALAGDRLLRW